MPGINAEEPPPPTPTPAPIAIVGMSCRMPGAVSSLPDFWDMMVSSRDGRTEFPADRFNPATFYHPNPDRKDCINTRHGYFVDQDVSTFDAGFFKMGATEAAATVKTPSSTGPQHRLLLECAFEALEDAGIPKEQIAGRDVGVFATNNMCDYTFGQMNDVHSSTPMSAALGNACMLSNGISYHFDLKGPSVTVETACSSTLSAMHQAAQSLRWMLLSNLMYVQDSKQRKKEEAFAQIGNMVPVNSIPWPQGKRYAAVNNFGFGGTNAHCVLEQAPTNKPTLLVEHNGSKDDTTTNPFLFALSANDEAAFTARKEQLVQFLQSSDQISARDLAYTLGQRRSHLSWRTAGVASSTSELATALPSSGGVRCGQRSPRLAFIFPGQGSQWFGMGRELFYRYPVFAQAIRETDAILEKLGADFVLAEQMFTAGAESRIDQPEISQPATTALQVALVVLLRSWGVEPCAVVGHSSGEIAAAFAAGILSLESATRAAYYRGQFTAALRTEQPDLRGGMIAIMAGADEISPLLSAVKAGTVVVACENSPKSITASGDEAGLAELEVLMREKRILHKRLDVDVPYHSPFLEHVLELYKNLEGLEPQPKENHRAAFYSTILELAGKLYSMGVALKFGEVNFPAATDGTTETAPRLVEGLSPYPWSRSRYWLDSRLIDESLRGEFVRHDLLGRPLEGLSGGETTWKNVLRMEDLPWLRDYRLQSAVFPFAGFISTAVEAAAELATSRRVDFDGFLLREVRALEPLVLEEGVRCDMATKLRPMSGTWDEFEISTWDSNTKGWVHHCCGFVGIRKGHQSSNGVSARFEKVSKECQRVVDRSKFYQEWARVSPQRGPTFQNVLNLRYGNGQAADNSEFEKLKRVLLTADEAVWVTKGAQKKATNPDGSIVAGFARTLRYELGTKVATLDLDPDEDDEEDAEGQASLVAEVAARIGSSSGGRTDMEYLEEDGMLLVPRLVDNEPVMRACHAATGVCGPSEQRVDPARRAKLVMARPGAPETLYLDDADDLGELQDSEIEVRVAATGVTMKDARAATSLASGCQLGTECSGTVTRIGAEVEGLAVGGRVCCLSADAFGSFARCRASSAAKIPDDMSLDVAAALPADFTQAYYAAVEEGRLRQGERVLVHAHGSLGQAVVQVAAAVGAEVFTSRDDQTPQDVDLVVNTLPGDVEFVQTAWQFLAPFGRFVQVGDTKGTLTMPPIGARGNCSFAYAAIDAVAAGRPRLMADIWSRVMELVASKRIGPDSSTLSVIPFSQLPSALRGLSSGTVTAKNVVINKEGDTFQGAPFENTTYEDFKSASESKITGAWNLHCALTNAPDLDFFIMFSSTAGVLGMPGHIGYSAANTYLDGLAQFRVQKGLPATSLALGFVLDAGYLAERADLTQLRRIGGLEGEFVTAADVIALLTTAINGKVGANCIMGIGFGGDSSNAKIQPSTDDARLTNLSLRGSGSSSGQNQAQEQQFMTNGDSGETSLFTELRRAVDKQAALNLVLEAVTKKVAALLLVPIEDVRATNSTAELGLDSLTMMELMNWVATDFRTRLRMTDLFHVEGLLDLSSQILEKSGVIFEK
ncbi:putative polyketide synthase protein [Neofusicoccum parvum UCRNP2]|uniref:Putative polyketide synthase protein n=1 Tax=Botryosphaeria parva (strain UCR-NP2) TaxID=1287680 RepID=R1GXJ7_BOTPV|nr:putative polyketide synthase protein [Neofusicoccum parvum UCRNP2]